MARAQEAAQETRRIVVAGTIAALVGLGAMGGLAALVAGFCRGGGV